MKRPLRLLYQLISANRRLIAGSAGCLSPAEGAPSFHRGARLAWLGLAAFLVITSLACLGPSGNPAVITACGLGLPAALTLIRLQKSCWDTWGRWAAHLVLGGLLWLITGLLPDIPALPGIILTTVLLSAEARRRRGARPD